MNTQSLYCNYSQKTGFKLEVEIYLIYIDIYLFIISGIKYSMVARWPVLRPVHVPQRPRQAVKLKPSYDPQQTWPLPRLRLLTSTK